MNNALTYIALTIIFYLFCASAQKDFRGSSELAYSLLVLGGFVGFICSHIAIIWSFWHFKWWLPIVVYIGAIMGSGILQGIILRSEVLSIIMNMIAPILSITFAILSIVGLANM